jgi:hypothetical protein
MSLERCCCVFATKKLGLTPLKAIAPIAIAYGIFIKRKNTSRVGGYLCDGTKSRSDLFVISVSSCATLTT